MIYNNNSMLGHGRSNLLFNLNSMFDNTVGSYNNTYSGNHIKEINWKYVDDDWKYAFILPKNRFKAVGPAYARRKKKIVKRFKKINIFNQFIYSPMYYDNVPFFDTKHNFSKKNFLKTQNYFNDELDASGNIKNKTFIKNTLSCFK